MTAFAGDGAALRELLFYHGMELLPGAEARNNLVEYLTVSRPERQIEAVAHTGWHRNSYVRPDQVIAPDDSDENGAAVVYQGDISIAATAAWRQMGELDEWKREVADIGAENSRPGFALSLALAPPLLPFAHEPGGLVHFVGPSKIAKTLLGALAESVWGPPGKAGFGSTWRATANGLEAVCASRNHCLLSLDEIGELGPREAGGTAYMIANGSSKIRMSKAVKLREPRTWSLLAISTGEVGLADHMSEAGKHPRAGQIVRMAEIPAEVSQESVFDTIPRGPEFTATCKALYRATEHLHGTAGVAWLRHLVALGPDRIETLVQERMAAWRATPPVAAVLVEASAQVDSVAGRFALIAAAGEMGSEAGILPWPTGTANHAAAVCFIDWLENRGGTERAEVVAAIDQVRAIIERDGLARFATLQADATGDELRDGLESMTAPAGNDAERIISLLGYRKKNTAGLWEWFVLPMAWKNELCAGFNPKLVAKALAEHGLLIRSGDGGHLTRLLRLPGSGPRRFYCVSSKILSENADEDQGGGT